MTASRAELVHLYWPPGHNFVGHHGGKAGTHPMVRAEELHCRAGRGVAGDRFLDHRPDYRRQVTFFALETHPELCARLGGATPAPSVYRRNVVTRGLDLNGLIGAEFVLQGVRFAGTEECRPCPWMNDTKCG